MKGLNIMWMIIIFILIITLMGFGYWVYLLPKPMPGVDCHKHTNQVWSENCQYLLEKAYDSTIPSPENLKPYLLRFSKSEGAGPPLSLPMWYRFRFVNTTTGNYSDFSQWIDSPVIAGSTNLPCVDGAGKCISPSISQGAQTCLYNSPLVGVLTSSLPFTPLIPIDDSGSFLAINLHRYVSSNPNDANPPDDDVEDEIVGYFFPNSISGVDYMGWIDMLNNPCSSGKCAKSPGC